MFLRYKGNKLARVIDDTFRPLGEKSFSADKAPSDADAIHIRVFSRGKINSAVTHKNALVGGDSKLVHYKQKSRDVGLYGKLGLPESHRYCPIREINIGKSFDVRILLV